MMSPTLDRLAILNAHAVVRVRHEVALAMMDGTTINVLMIE